MTSYTYNTPSGTEINIRIVTRETNLADGRFENDCYRLELAYNGRTYTPMGIEERPDYPHGLFHLGGIERNGRLMAHLVPMDARAREIYNEYRAEVRRRVRTELNTEADYQASRQRIRNAMNQ